MTEKVFGSENNGSIRDIPLPGSQGEGTSLNLKGPEGGNTGLDDWGSAKRKNKRSLYKLVVFVLLIIGAVTAYSIMFHTASVTVTPKVKTVAITPQDFKATIQGGDVEFTRVNPFSKTIEMNIEGSIEENRQTKSSGLITVFNTDSKSKNYIKNTRFQTEDGRIYRAFQRFVIPAGSSENPGEVDVLVVAENPGEKFNSQEGLSFKLPALKENGDPDYNLVYARQKEALSGGFSGVVRVPTSDDVDEAKEKLRARIEQELQEEFFKAMPETYFVDESYVAMSEVSFTEQPNQAEGGLDLSATAELTGVAFEKQTLENFLASQYVADYTGDSVVNILNISELDSSITSSDFDPSVSEEFRFTVEGEGEFIWTQEAGDIAQLLAGRLQSHISSGLINGLSNVASLEVDIKPFWRRSLPKDYNNIDVTINNNN